MKVARTSNKFSFFFSPPRFHRGVWQAAATQDVTSDTQSFLPSTLSSRPAGGEAARLVEVEEEEEEVGGRETSDDFSTISGYDSLEAGLNFNSEGGNISSTDCLLSFSNPNYSGPELAARVSQKPEKEMVNRRRGGLRDEEDQHTTFAAALMSPPVDDLPHPGAALELREAGSMSVRYHYFYPNLSLL